MKLLLVVAAALAVVSCANDSVVDPEFHAWKLKFERSYSSPSEEAEHMQIWLRNREAVLEHNAMADQSNSSYRLGMTNFADMEPEEFTRNFSSGSFNASRPRQHFVSKLLHAIGQHLPQSMDWRAHGLVTSVKDQKKCACDWPSVHDVSFCGNCTTGSLEGQHFKTTQNLVSLSEQQLVDCSEKYGSSGCHGGSVEAAFKYIMAYGGIEMKDTYKYVAQKQTCSSHPDKIIATCSDYQDVLKNDEQALKVAVATIGPISVGIDASLASFRNYESGVYDESDCSSTFANHYALVVGYGKENGKDYWLVKNSWGTAWGEEGYIKMKRDSGNQCGIASEASFPMV
ncbi:procathepsin L [Pleuronectes platessa]|uniref:procathepsin L n=1 Tax=Pleuronectes platessa TaxID=8262 RepID=UPI00232A4D9C|nr:procathepsin L [Pleuronectes platessa]